jgi:hypothetical protein
MASAVVKPRNIATEICARLGFDPSKTMSITIHLSATKAEVEVHRFLTETDGKMIGESLKSYRLVET